MQPAENLIEEYEAALATHDWEQVAPLIHDDCVAIFSEGTFIGKQQVEVAFHKTFDLIQDEKYMISSVHWILQQESVAVFNFEFHWTCIIKGKPASGGGRGTSTIVLQDGDWVLIAEHLGPHAR